MVSWGQNESAVSFHASNDGTFFFQRMGLGGGREGGERGRGEEGERKGEVDGKRRLLFLCAASLRWGNECEGGRVERREALLVHLCGGK